MLCSMPVNSCCVVADKSELWMVLDHRLTGFEAGIQLLSSLLDGLWAGQFHDEMVGWPEVGYTGCDSCVGIGFAVCCLRAHQYACM